MDVILDHDGMKSAVKKHSKLYVIKRDGSSEPINLNEITDRIVGLCEMHPPLDDHVDAIKVVQDVVRGLYPGIKTSQLDDLAAETAGYMTTTHPDYSILAARIAVSNLQKNVPKRFTEAMKLEYENTTSTGEAAPLLSETVYAIIQKHGTEFDEMIDPKRDFDYDYFGFKTLERAYLAKVRKRIVETPQYMLLRVAIGIHKYDIERIRQSYHLMSNFYFTHATPTLFNAGTPCEQMSSCFLLSMTADSIEGIYDTLKRCALISKSAGGIGVSVHNIRASASYIRGTNGQSNGLVPMLRVYNDTARYVDQCFYGSTFVMTRNGPTMIKDLKADDTVLTHLGNYKNVTKLVEHPADVSRQMVNIKTKHASEPLNVTAQHQFLALRNQTTEVADCVIQAGLDSGYLSVEWVDAKDLEQGDHLCFPLDHNDVDISWSEEDCRFFGIFCGSGYISKSGNSYVILMQNILPATMTFVESYINKKGLRWHKSADISQPIVYSFTGTGLCINRDTLYDENDERRINSSLLCLPLNKTLQLLKGFVESSGQICDDGVMVELLEGNIIQSLRFMLMRKGILTNVSQNENNSFILYIPKREDVAKALGLSCDGNAIISSNNFAFSRVESVQTTTCKNEPLYDLEVDTDNSYVTDIGVVHNGGGKRKGAFAMYLEPWHADIFDFLELKKNTGKEEQRARDLFYALWIPDLFMKRLETDGDWTLFCPNEAKGLYDVWGKEFEELYVKYENTPGLARKTIKAAELWFAILDAQIETGVPYMLYKDSWYGLRIVNLTSFSNAKSNQKNLGTIRSSNLCTEIIEFTSADEVAVCNLGSIALPKFIENGAFNHEKLLQVTRVLTRNLNRVIDENYYPIPEAKKSNMRNRPIGIGVQGLADVFVMLRMPFESPEARQLNRDIFETIYFAALTESNILASEDGTYPTYSGSPVSNGILQFDMWGVEPSPRLGWSDLRCKIAQYGVRNSLLIAPMPTASTSQILGNNECFEPYTSNLYTRRVLAGEFILVNKHLVKDLLKLGLWTEEMKNQIIAENGSVQNIESIPKNLRDIYKTVWEISQKTIIDMAADRGAFIDQSQSLNIFFDEPTYERLTSMHFYGWKKGLKTGMYYLRTKAAADAIKFTLEPPKPTTDKTQVTGSEENVSQNEPIQACPLRKPGSNAYEPCGPCSA